MKSNANATPIILHADNFSPFNETPMSLGRHQEVSFDQHIVVAHPLLRR